MTTPAPSVTDHPAPSLPDPSAEELLLNAARHAGMIGELERCAAIYRELLECNPEHAAGRKELAARLMELGRPADALHHLTVRLRAAPDDHHTLVKRAAILADTGRFEAAEADLHRALGVDPSHVPAHHQLGLVMSKRGLWNSAPPFFRRAIELDPGSASTYRDLGDALNHVDDLEGALQAYSRSVELEPNDVVALRGLGVIHDRLGQPEHAAIMYRRSRELNHP